MMTVVEVKCPHCGARGKLMLPPLGAIIVGPCPECNELVAVFCGHVLALDKEVILNANQHDKREHLLGVLIDFLQEHADELVQSAEQNAVKSEQDDGEEELGLSEGESEAPAAMEEVSTDQISQSELESFIDRDLRLIDDESYFRRIFSE